MQIQQEALDRFFWFINERHKIYIKYKMNKEPWPWTDDDILKTYKFCEIFRELDTGTIWLRENWREPYSDHTELFFNICLYRQFNWIETAEAIGFTEEWNARKVEELLRARKAEGHRIYTNAHMLTGTLGGDKITQTVHKVLTPLWANIDDYEPTIGDNLESTFKKLLKAPGYGPFISYEVVTDLRHTRYLEDADDINTWANAGPGAMRGINRLYGVKASEDGGTKFPTKLFKPKEYLGVMRWLLDVSSDHTEDHVPELELREIEHSLCEFDKYCRVLFGEGRPRMKYIPPHLRQV